MKKLFLIILCVFNFNLSFAQLSFIQKSVVDTIIVTFNKVKPSFENWSTAKLKVNAQPNTKNVVLTFEVPNYNLRFKTTFSDYCIIETDIKQYKLLNQKEVFIKETLNYTFTFVIPKEDLIDIMNSSLKRITFYFVPNEKFVKGRLDADKFIGEELKLHFVRVARMTMKYKVSKPDETQYNALKSWLKSN